MSRVVHRPPNYLKNLPLFYYLSCLPSLRSRWEFVISPDRISRCSSKYFSAMHSVRFRSPVGMTGVDTPSPLRIRGCSLFFQGVRTRLDERGYVQKTAQVYVFRGHPLHIEIRCHWDGYPWYPSRGRLCADSPPALTRTPRAWT